MDDATIKETLPNAGDEFGAPESMPPHIAALNAVNASMSGDVVITRIAAANTIRQAQGERDKAYRERAALVAYLAATYPAVIDYREDRAWPVVIIETPSGQMGWHIAMDDAHLFDFLPKVTHQRELYDGHTTGEKYQRLGELVRTVATGIYGRRVETKE